jgi:hypothetical protein
MNWMAEVGAGVVQCFYDRVESDYSWGNFQYFGGHLILFFWDFTNSGPLTENTEIQQITTPFTFVPLSPYQIGD